MSSDGFGDQPGQGQFGQGPFGQGQPGQGQFGQAPFDAGQPGQPGPGQFGQAPYGQGQPGQGQFGQQPGWQQPNYGQPGPYMQVGAGWPQMAGRRTNGLAIAALCCAIGQVIAGPFAGIAAIVLGSISLKQIRLSGEDGRGMAITGLVLGIVGTIVVVLIIVFALALVHGIATDNNLNNLNNLNN